MIKVESQNQLTCHILFLRAPIPEFFYQSKEVDTKRKPWNTRNRRDERMPRVLGKGSPREIAAPGTDNSRRTEDSRRDGLRWSVPQEEFLLHSSLLPYFF